MRTVPVSNEPNTLGDHQEPSESVVAIYLDMFHTQGSYRRDLRL